MQIVKMFAALLMAAGVMQTLATQARAQEPVKLESSLTVESAGCGWTRPYHYRYHYRPHRPSPFRHPRAPRPRRRVPAD